ncbi:hypothetical protein MOUN0_M02410 [Monosporozyma unispora]
MSFREEDRSLKQPLVEDILERLSDDEEIVTFDGLLPIEEDQVPDHADEEDINLQKLYEEMKDLHKQKNVLKKPSLFVVSILVFLFGFAEMLYLTPFITLTINKICVGINIGSCDSEEVQMRVSQIGSITLICSGIISTLMGGKWGQWSDQYGRVKIFGYMGVIRVFGNFLHLMTLTSWVPYNQWLIILSATLNSTSGGMFAFFGNVNSYIADVVEPEDRISSISLVNSLMQVTTGVGPLMGSLLVKWYNGNDAVPIYLAMITGILFTILCFTVVEEPRHQKILKYTREQVVAKQLESHLEYNNEIMRSTTLWYTLQLRGKYHISKLVALLSPLKQLWLKDRPSTVKWNVILLVLIDILFMSVITGIMPSFLLFCTFKYHWKSVELGYFISTNGIMSGITLFISSHYGITLLKKVFPTKVTHVDILDKVTIGSALIFLTCSNFIMIEYSNFTGVILLFIIFRSLARICSPVTEATIMKHYKRNGKNVGQVFGAIALLNSLSMLIVPPILLRIYGVTIGIKPELFLYFPLGCCLLALTSCLCLNLQEPADNASSISFSENTATVTVAIRLPSPSYGTDS